MNFLDLFIIIVIALTALSGYRRGFILGVHELLMLAIGLLVASATYPLFARLLDRFIDAQPAMLNIAGFVIAIILVQAITSMTLGLVVGAIRGVAGIVPGVTTADRIAGIIPGFIHGLLIATIILIPIALFPVPGGIREPFNESQFARKFYQQSSDRLLRAVTFAGLDIDDFVAITPRQTGAGYTLPFRVTSGLEVNESLEMQMFELVNQERVTAGLAPLVWDPELVPVARAHSQEMFEEGYFAHESPITGSPFDRLAAAGITYRTAGENLALAPTLEVAHQGLMDSPGHRANILEPSYGRIGIGVVSSPGRGSMFTQLFRD